MPMEISKPKFYKKFNENIDIEGYNYENYSKKTHKNKFKLINKGFMIFKKDQQTYYLYYNYYIGKILLLLFLCFVDFFIISWKYLLTHTNISRAYMKTQGYI